MKPKKRMKVAVTPAVEVDVKKVAAAVKRLIEELGLGPALNAAGRRAHGGLGAIPAGLLEIAEGFAKAHPALAGTQFDGGKVQASKRWLASRRELRAMVRALHLRLEDDATRHQALLGSETRRLYRTLQYLATTEAKKVAVEPLERMQKLMRAQNKKK